MELDVLLGKGSLVMDLAVVNCRLSPIAGFQDGAPGDFLSSWARTEIPLTSFPSHAEWREEARFLTLPTNGIVKC